MIAESKTRPKGFNVKKSKITPVQLIVIGYLSFALLGTLLLSLPISLQPGVELSFIDALFTATSAISVTGLTVTATNETFSNVGLAILMIWLQFGGIGIMTLGTLMYVVFGRQINLRGRMLIKVDQNQTSLEGLVVLMLFILKLAVFLELIAAVILTGHFYFHYAYEFKTALKLGVFHALSAFTNAGFDLFGDSLQGFPQDYFLHTVIAVLLILGAIGFPVLLEIRCKILYRRRFSLFTKVTTLTFFALLVVGFLVVLIGEAGSSLNSLPWHQKIAVALFQSLTTRNGGFSTYDITQFHNATLMFFCLLMFIGASPSSCGGGIRTTTFAVVLMSIFTFWRDKENVQVFKRELYAEDIHRSYAVFTLAIILVFFSTVAILEIEPFSATQVLFEVCSAFGTTGLSLGITPQLSTASKIILILLMFIGRIGLLSLLLLPHRPGRKSKIHYVKERIIVG
ncbi:potassium uptake TrkH family protein [Desulfohalotomaculum tongense]|uniref:TrkH family potassium uptake protein n=1 Tax=Desulforadius tongensis TaxID=1216062 RepID=UPI00195D746C|nr:TrkH family potassium uptake protein [Desulforadius tongensis]MBM7854751.1 potassium uptake TrkH family protein [Desulforadius tongensis]